MTKAYSLKIVMVSIKVTLQRGLTKHVFTWYNKGTVRHQINQINQREVKMTKDLKKGTRIYYGGDMANEEGLGVITRRIKDQFGTFVDIRMDDKRFLPLISVIAFSDKYLGHGGTRFVTEEAYMDFRQDQIDKVEATLAQKDAERSTTTKKVRCPDVSEGEAANLCAGDPPAVNDDELDAMLVKASEEAEKRRESDKKELYDVWKDETAYHGLKWKVQMKHGVGSYKTKRAAIESAEAWKKADAEGEARATAARIAAPTNTGITTQILRRSDFRTEKKYVWEGLCESACLTPSMVKELTIYIKVPKEITKEEYDGKASTEAEELRCKTCHNWRPEDSFKDGYSNTYGYVLTCPNCKAWNTGIIESRPVQRSKKVDVEGIVRDRKEPRKEADAPKSASYIPMGEKLDCDDAVYRKKALSSWIVELIGGTDRGGMIRFWKKAEPSDVVDAEVLPHIYNTTPDKKWALQDEVHFAYFINADGAYGNIKTVKDAQALIWDNR